MRSTARRLVLTTLLLALATAGVVAYQRYGEITSELGACRESLRLVLEELRELQAYSTSLHSNCTTLRESYLQLRSYAESLLANCSTIEEAYLRVSEKLQSAYVELGTCREIYRRLSEDYGKLREDYEATLLELELLREAVPVLVSLHQQALHVSVTSFSYSNGTLTVALVSNYSVVEVGRPKHLRVGETAVYLATPKPGFVLLEVNISSTSCFTVEAVNVYYVANYSSRTTYYSGRYCGYTTLLIPALPHQTLVKVLPHYPWDTYELGVRYLHIR